MSDVTASAASWLDHVLLFFVVSCFICFERSTPDIDPMLHKRWPNVYDAGMSGADYVATWWVSYVQQSQVKLYLLALL